MPKENKKKETTKQRIAALEQARKDMERLRSGLPDLPGQKKREKEALLAQMRLNAIRERSNPFGNLPWPGKNKKKKGGKRSRTRRKRKSKKGRKTRRVRRRR
jgi:hypothetical protein